jgi:aspartate carbamoyltransferase catalytic subunit
MPTVPESLKELAHSFKGRSVVSMRDFTTEEILMILSIAEAFEEERRPLLQGRILGSLFFEPSTRTRISFDTAMQRLGGTVIGFVDPSSTSLEKGESLSDTVKVVEGYCDVMLIRHPFEGAARLADDSTSRPVINGGDGSNQHPTQTFLDLYTLKKAKGRLEGLKIAFVGDLKYGRTVHSLAETMARFSPELQLVSPPSLRMPAHILEDLGEKGVFFREDADLSAVNKQTDVIYATRIQKERFPDSLEYEKVKNAYQLDPGILDKVGEEVSILHPLPRVNEIDTALDAYGGALYFKQAHNGVIVRMALLALMLGACDG